MSRRPFFAQLTTVLALTVAAAAVPFLSQRAVAAPASASAQQTPPADQRALQVTQHGNAVDIRFAVPTKSTQVAAASASDQSLQDTLARIHYGDLILPGQLATVVLDADTTIDDLTRAGQSSVASTASVAYTGKIEQADVPVPQTADGQHWPDLQRAAIITLPPGPISVLSQGTLRGVRVAVLAITPIYAQDGQTRFASRFGATLRGLRLIDNATSLLSAFDADSARAKDALPQSTNATCTGDTSYQPLNQQLKSNSPKLWRIRVQRAGMQQVSSAALSAAGVTDPIASLRVTFRGQTISVRRFGEIAIRFYAQDPGDRWNAFDTYWLSVDGSPSPEMGSRGAPIGNPAASTAALQRGKYANNKIYDATMPGADGDHWFAADLKAANGTAGTWSFTPSGIVLPASGASKVYVAFAGKTNSNHSLTLSTSSGNAGTVVAGVGTFTATFNIPGDFNGASSFAVQPQASNAPEVILPDYVSWERNVSLNFGGNGARFNINAGSGNYQALNSTVVTLGNDVLYDVTDPIHPEVVLMDGTGKFSHTNGDHTYVMAGNGTLWNSGAANEPALSKYTPFPNDAAFNLQVLYITPGAFAGAADALTKYRQAQGYAAGYFGVESIYDWWSFGQVSPSAIRNFLRYAYCTWSVKPISVAMLGDGSVDPFDYSGYNTAQYGNTNVTFIPPYMAPVDPYLTTSLGAAETACEACYAQLDGADPLNDKISDLYYGRMPAKTAAEATALVNKIIGYETAAFRSPAGDMTWRNRVAYVTDNFYNVDGSTDGAGNFLRFAQDSIAGLPRTIQPIQMYYDPYNPNPTASAGTRETDAQKAYDRTKAIFNAGMGIINYYGHGNWADMAATDGEPYYLWYFLDADGLTNAGKLPIVLQMTCLTSAFQTPVQYYGTSVDERLVLVPNGAVATWGSSSLGVTYSHEALSKGFYDTLWSGPAFGTQVGKAAAGGYVELFTQVQGVPQVDNLLYTFMIMGDPMTLARVGGYRTLTPVVAR